MREGYDPVNYRQHLACNFEAPWTVQLLNLLATKDGGLFVFTMEIFSFKYLESIFDLAVYMKLILESATRWYY